MVWQDKGDFLLVKADRHKKSKKNTYISFEVFRLREKGVPVESIELTDTIIDFKWELKGGKRFAVIHGATATATRTTVTFYSCETKTLKTLGTFLSIGLFFYLSPLRPSTLLSLVLTLCPR